MSIPSNEKKVHVMDLASILGLALCAVVVIFGIVNGAGFGGLKYFYDLPSILITLGGAFCCVMAEKTMPDFLNGVKSIKLIFKLPQYNLPEVIRKIIELSNVARKEGLLALEEASAELDDAFLRKGVLLIVDGTDPELVRGILETEMACIDDRHKKNITFWLDLAGMGPAWGMIGTLIGLILMLQDMNDPSTIGPSMAVALITTLYGSILANWVATPVAQKLGVNNNAEMAIKEVMIEGLLSIQAGENPRVIEEKLKSFLSPADKEAMDAAGGDLDG